MQREPQWACPDYQLHGERAVCGMCLERFRDQGDSISTDLPPPVEFGRGWFSVGAVHWFEATDATVYVARDGRRVLAQAACGAISDVTTTRAPLGEHECRECLRALDEARSVFPRRQGGDSSLRIYRGLKKPYDATRVVTDRLSCSNFTDSAFWALQYASARRGVVLVVDVPVGSVRVSEELWLEQSAKRYGVWGRFDEYIVAQIPAKELRAEVRRKGIVTLDVVDKAQVLAQYVARQLSTGHARNDILTRH
jgi:hypothetical protein